MSAQEAQDQVAPNKAGAKPGRPKARRRWWQLLCRAAVLIVLAVSGAYVTLPWWAPTGLLRDWIARDLSRQMDVPVEIAEVSLSWSGGVEIRGLRVHCPPEFGSEPILEVPRIRMDLSPIDYVFRKRLAWVEIEAPTVRMEIAESGDVNLAPLTKLSWDVEADRVSIRRASASIKFPASDRLLRINVADVQYLAGRMKEFGRMTMSAQLVQSGGSAPVGLQASGTGRGEVAATASFSFSHVDLTQIPLARLAGLPLRKLAGRCRGSLSLQIDRDGVVDQFSCNLAIQNLDVELNTGARLPVIEKAVFRMSARCDFFPAEEGMLWIQSARVYLPGVMDLTGRANIFVGDGLRWEAIKSMHLKGEVFPKQLAKLLWGWKDLPGDLELDLPVNVNVSAGYQEIQPQTPPSERDENLLPFFASANLTPVKIGRKNLHEAIKPTGVTLVGELGGTLDRRDSSLIANHGKIVLGRNEFLGNGGIKDLHAMIRRWTSEDFQWTLASLLADLKRMQWEGTWQINEIDSLRHIVPGLAHAKLKKGRISGGWSLDARRGHLVEFDLDAPAGTELSVLVPLAGRGGEPTIVRFDKPADKAMTMRLGGNLAPSRSAVSDLWADLWIGGARASLSGGLVQLRSGGQGERSHLVVDAEGKFDAEGIEEMLACVDVARRWPVRLSGDLEGRFRLRLMPGVRTGHLSADLTGLAIDWPPKLHKPAGQEASLEVSAAFDDSASSGGHRVSASWRSDQANLHAEVNLPRDTRTAPIVLRAYARVADARWLTQTFPALPELLAVERLSGAMRADVTAAWRPGRCEADVRLDGTDLEYASKAYVPGADGARPSVRRVKRAGVPLRAWIRGSLARGKDRTVLARVSSAGIELASSRISLDGSGVFQPAKSGQAPSLYPPPNLRDFQCTIKADCALDGPTRQFLPELADLAEKHDLSGAVRASAHVSGDRRSVSLKANFDAADLGAGRLWPVRIVRKPPKDDKNAKEEVLLAGHWIKPPGLAAGGRIDLTYNARESRLTLDNLRARVGDLEIAATGSAPVSDSPHAVPVSLDRTTARVSLTTEAAENLSLLLPDLKKYHLAGDMSVEAEWQDTGPTRLRLARLSAKNLQGQYRNRVISLAGEVVLGNVRRAAAPQGPNGPEAERSLLFDSCRTDGLIFRGGASRGWLVADVRGLPHRPSGTFYLCARNLDEQELVSVLSFRPPAAATTQPLTLTKSQITKLRTRAAKIILKHVPTLLKADLTGQVYIGRLKTFDLSVAQDYIVHHVVVDLAVDHGAVKLDYVASLNGGSLRNEAKTNLNDSDALVSVRSEIRDVSATEEFQPQLSKFFPGNRFNGLFNRTETVQITLANWVANTLDARYPPGSVGTAKTVVTDGLTKGRAAPKFITRIFPGLDLAEYRYRKMTSFTDFLPGGLAKNEMIFDGRTYDLYIDGTTDARNMGRYNVGLIVLGTSQSAELNRRLRLGRVPLLILKARIEGGKMHDLSVRYPWPYETLREVLIENNIAYRVWLDARRKLKDTARP